MVVQVYGRQQIWQVRICSSSGSWVYFDPSSAASSDFAIVWKQLQPKFNKISKPSGHSGARTVAVRQCKCRRRTEWDNFPTSLEASFLFPRAIMVAVRQCKCRMGWGERRCLRLLSLHVRSTSFLTSNFFLIFFY